MARDFSQLVLQPGYPIYQRQSGQPLQKIYQYKTNKAGHESLFPQDGAFDPELEEGFTFQSASASATGDPSKVDVRMVYAPGSGGSGRSYVISGQKKEVGTVTYNSDTTVSERPIETHPSYGNASFDAYIDEKNIKSYMVSNITFSRNETKDAKRVQLTESFLISGIMQRQSPTGLSGASSTKWVKNSRSVRYDGNLLEVQDTWMYDAQSWAGVDWGQFNT